MAAGVIITLASGIAACTLTGADAIEIDSPALLVRDVVSLDCLAEHARGPIGALEIARLNGVAAQVLTRTTIAALVRRRAPAMVDVDLGGDGRSAIRISPPRRTAAPSLHPPCYIAARAIDVGDIIVADAITAAPCATHSPPRALDYDRRYRVMRARRVIGSGEYLGAVVSPPRFAADAGEELTLVARVGPVEIRRRVEAVAPSTGARVFVRGEDGDIFTVPSAAAP